MAAKRAGARGARAKGNDASATLGLEAKLWAAADALRNNMDAAEYKHVVLGLIFLKYISDAFESKHAEQDALNRLRDAKTTFEKASEAAEKAARKAAQAARAAG